MTIQSIQQLPTYADFEGVTFSRDPKDYEKSDEEVGNKIFDRLEGLSILEIIKTLASNILSSAQIVKNQDPFLPLKVVKLDKEPYDLFIHKVIDHQPEYGKSAEFSELSDAARRVYIMYRLAEAVKDVLEKHNIEPTFNFTFEGVCQSILDAFEDCLLEEVGFRKVAVWIKALVNLNLKDEWKKQKWWVESLYEQTYLGEVAEILDLKKRDLLKSLPEALDDQIDILLDQLAPVNPQLVNELIEELNEGYPDELLDTSEEFVASMKKEAYESVVNDGFLKSFKNEVLNRLIVKASSSEPVV